MLNIYLKETVGSFYAVCSLYLSRKASHKAAQHISSRGSATSDGASTKYNKIVELRRRRRKEKKR